MRTREAPAPGPPSDPCTGLLAKKAVHLRTSSDGCILVVGRGTRRIDAHTVFDYVARVAHAGQVVVKDATGGEGKIDCACLEPF